MENFHYNLILLSIILMNCCSANLFNICSILNICPMLNIKSDCFRAAVYEHIPHGNISLDSPQKIIDMNLKVFEEITKKAAKSV